MEIKEANYSLFSKLRNHNDFCGTSSNGVDTIKVMVSKKSSSIMKLIPKTYESFNINIEITGPFKMLQLFKEN
jgi:hypothetical protein